MRIANVSKAQTSSALAAVDQAIEEAIATAHASAEFKRLFPSKLTLPPRGATIDTIVVHQLPHFDDLFGALLIILFGSRYWKISPNVRIVTANDDEAKKLAKKKNVIAVGAAEGDFDDHKETGRVAKICATDLVALFLGLREDPAYKVLVDYANRADTQRDQDMLELANAIKLVNYDRDRGEPEVRSQISWRVVQTIMRSVIKLQTAAPCPILPWERTGQAIPLPARGAKVNTIVVRKLAPFDHLFAALMIQLEGDGYWEMARKVKLVHASSEAEAAKLAKKGDAVVVGIGRNALGEGNKTKCITELAMRHLGCYERKAFKRGLEYARQAANGKPMLPFDLATLIGDINHDGSMTPLERSETAWDVVETVMSSFIVGEIEFTDLCPVEFNKTGSMNEIGQKRGIILAMVESDLPRMNRFLRHKGADVVAQMNAKGNLNLFPDEELIPLMPDFYREALTIENARNKKLTDVQRKKALEEYEACLKAHNEGRQLPYAPHLYAFFKAGMFLNGSLSHSVQATHLTFEDIKRICIKVFGNYDGNLSRDFKRDKKPAPKPDQN